MCVVAQAVHCIVLLFTSHIRDFENLIWQFLQQMAIIYLILRKSVFYDKFPCKVVQPLEEEFFPHQRYCVN